MIKELHEQLVQKQVSAVELVEEHLQRITTLDQRLGAFLTVTSDSALEQAKKVDEKIARGEDIPLLAGIPAAVKDIIATKGIKTTAASV